VMNVCEAHDDRHRNAPEPPHAQEAFAEYCAYVKKLERMVDVACEELNALQRTLPEWRELLEQKAEDAS